MPTIPDARAIVLGLRPAPRSLPEQATRRCPRAEGKLGAAAGAILFGGLLLGVAIAILADGRALRSDREKAPVAGLIGAGLVATGVWLVIARKRVIATCRDVLRDGTATVGRVESVDVKLVGGAATVHYRIGYDAAGAGHVLKAFWRAPDVVYPEGTAVAVLYDPQAPARAAIVPLDYPDLPLDVAPTDDMPEVLARLGVPLDFGVTTAESAFAGGLVKATLYQGVRKLEAGDAAGAISAFDIALRQAEGGTARLRAVILEQRGLAHEKQGEHAAAHADFMAALALEPGRDVSTRGAGRVRPD